MLEGLDVLVIETNALAGKQDQARGKTISDLVEFRGLRLRACLYPGTKIWCSSDDRERGQTTYLFPEAIRN